jgi:hypothetical protein
MLLIVGGFEEVGGGDFEGLADGFAFDFGGEFVAGFESWGEFGGGGR